MIAHVQGVLYNIGVQQTQNSVYLTHHSESLSFSKVGIVKPSYKLTATSDTWPTCNRAMRWMIDLGR